MNIISIPFKLVDDDNPIPFEQEDPELGDLVAGFIKKIKPLFLMSKRKQHHPIYLIDCWSMTMGLGRNDPCPCQSGKKFKKCCINT